MKPIALPIKKRKSRNWKKISEKNVPEVLARLFDARGINDANSVILSGKKLLPWTSMKGIEEGVDRLVTAIKKKEKIVIVADYDSDGATSCAIGMLALKSFGALVDFKVPNRFVHGYGLSVTVVNEVVQDFNPSVLVTVDNGISSIDGVNRANELGVDVIVTDHHLPLNDGSLPKAKAIINPNQPGCEFSSKNLAGCGVIYYLMAALRAKLEQEKLLKEGAAPIQNWLDLVAIGTIADVVKLDENNRLIARMGLDRIRNGNAHPGVAALFTVAKRKTGKATSSDIGFAIGPRINAAGRLDDMSVGIKCLIEDDFAKALELALTLDDLNQERKAIEQEMQNEANIMVWEGQEKFKSSIALKSKDFHEGVIGIVAGRIKEREHRPTIVFAPGQEPGLLKGSGRSIPGFHLRDALDLVYKMNPNLIVKFGGHAMAAGLTIKEEFFEDFQEAFDEVCSAGLTAEMLERFILTDELSPENMTVNTVELIQQEVWGNGFEEPIFALDMKVKSQRVLKDTHLKLELEKEGMIFDAIWFNCNELVGDEIVTVVFSLSINDFRNTQTVQLQIRQIA